MSDDPAEAHEALTDEVQTLLLELAGPSAKVTCVTPLIGGACQDNFQVDIVLDGAPQRLVLRRDAASSIKGSVRRRQEFPVINAAVAAGVKTPAARWMHEHDGVGGYFLDWAPGIAIGRVVVRNPELADARKALVGQLAEQLARIHTITPQTHPDLPIGALAATFDGDPVESALAGMQAMFEEMHEPHPALELAYEWLSTHRPPTPEVTLVHGDFRTGNFLVGPEGLCALLDWEFTHWGSPEEDLAWLCVRDWRFGRLKHPVGGFAQRAEFYAAYEAASGRTLDPAVVHYWEIFGNVRWAAGCVYQGERYLSGAQGDLELIAIARRAAEMEWEALRLIQTGPVMKESS